MVTCSILDMLKLCPGSQKGGTQIVNNYRLPLMFGITFFEILISFFNTFKRTIYFATAKFSTI